VSDVRIELVCPGCGVQVFAAVSEQGKIIDCPSCYGWLDVPEIGRPPTAVEIDEAAAARTAREWELNTQESSRQLRVNAQQLEQAQQALDHRRKQDARFDSILVRADEVISRWDQLAERMDRVLKNMERQTGGSSHSAARIE
jgi:Zn-finger nucleic acid-binding protein